MQVSRAEAHRIRIPFKHPFRHAQAERTHTETIIVLLHGDDSSIGCGEILPRHYLTGETVESVLSQYLPSLLQNWLGRRFETRVELVAALEEGLAHAGRELATFGGVELALLDLAGQSLQFDAGEVLGAEVGPPLDAGVVIGFDIKTSALSRHCAMLRLAGLRHVKVKVGRDDDVSRVKIVRRTSGPTVSLRIDANGAWSADVAIEMLRAMEPLAVESVEQPVPAHDLRGMRRVRETTGVPVMADESLCTLEDGHRLIETSAADVFNIRLGKCGGFLASLRLARLARSSGLGIHLGTLVGETGILTRAAEIFGRRVPGFACLEGKGQNTNFLKDDLAMPSSSAKLGWPAGLGLQLSRDKLARYSIGDAIEFEVSRAGG